MADKNTNQGSLSTPISITLYGYSVAGTDNRSGGNFENFEVWPTFEKNHEAKIRAKYAALGYSIESIVKNEEDTREIVINGVNLWVAAKDGKTNIDFITKTKEASK